MKENKINLNKKILVIGASSFIGKNFCNLIDPKSYHGTYTNNKVLNSTSFNLAKDNITDSLNLSNFSHALILGGIANPNTCFQDKEHSNKVNILGMKKLLDELYKNNIIPIFASTEAIFDGIDGYYLEEDKPNPILLYGKQKLEIEEYIKTNFSKYVIIRISRAFSINNKDNTLLNSMLKDLIKNKDIVCAKDQIMSPIYIDDCSKAILEIIKKDESGVFNIAGSQVLNRYELLSILLEKYNQKFSYNGKISFCSLNDFETSEIRPLDTSLNNGKISKLLEDSFKPIDFYCEKLVDFLNLSSDKKAL